MTSCDIIIVGAGPTGLSFARSLASANLSITVVEQQAEAALANPAPDGRDIALTHLSRNILTKLGIWQRLLPDDISPIREARVLDGTSARFLQFETTQDALGYLVPNHVIRKAVFDTVSTCANVKLIPSTHVSAITTDDYSATVQLAGGESLTGALLVAADSRFSDMRKKMGIPAKIQDFGRVVIVCRMAHDAPHHERAHECFLYDQTLAVLPLNHNQSSIVITVPTTAAENVLNMPEEQFNADIAQRFEHRLGDMRLVSKRYAYPLASVYAEQFIAKRFALLGDAAVGMHPVTAHGFNFGLRGQQSLAQEIIRAQRCGGDIGAANVLLPYQRVHRRATRPLYLMTNAIVKLYTNANPSAKFARSTLLRLASHMLPVRRFISSHLTEAEARKTS